MNGFMVQRLIAKDWYFLRGPLLAYAVGGAACLWLAVQPWELGFAVGSILLVAIIMTMAAHLSISVVDERANQTLAFVMSLPISMVEYSTAKLLACLLLFLGPWLVMLGGATFLILALPGMPNGLMPFMVLVLVELLVAYVFAIAVALVSESVPWTIVTVVVTNLGFQAWLYYVGHAPGIAPFIEGPVVLWNGSAIGLLAIEIVALVSIVISTVYLQSRKTDFL